MDPKPLSTPRRGGEFILGTIVFALPLLYMLTERTSEVFLWRYSKIWLCLIACYGFGYGILVWSYARPWPSAILLGRKFTVAMALSLVAALAIGETVLRLRDDAVFEALENKGRHAYDPDVGHVYRANYSQLIQSREFSTQWSSNAQGLRGERDFGAKAPGVARVLVVGDSFTVGDQVPYAETYPGVMQSEFDALYGAGRIEVLNAGFPGFGTTHERKWIEKFACALEPDLIVVGSTPNDLIENRFPILYEARNGALVDPKRTAGDHLKYEARRHWYSLPGLVARSRLAQRWDDMRVVDRLRGRVGSPHRHAFQIEQEPKSRTQYELYEAQILLAQGAARACGASFAVLAIPFEEQLRPPGTNQDFTLWGSRLVTIGARHGFPVVDLLPAFVRAPDHGQLYWREDSHCRAEGYRLIGAGATAALAALGSQVQLPTVEPGSR